eukprot:TRINITY_DN1291_c0_g1_i3.p2 TRINITY_DN1291_c0_g1~~TRINITY_DN1291_c0_g1_i3.p2  ORF type:complete len:214 (-),score=5.26 TRINITY_DN1291_c0_g1_i3:456-1097(-)
MAVTSAAASAAVAKTSAWVVHVLPLTMGSQILNLFFVVLGRRQVAWLGGLYECRGLATLKIFSVLGIMGVKQKISPITFLDTLYQKIFCYNVPGYVIGEISDIMNFAYNVQNLWVPTPNVIGEFYCTSNSEDFWQPIFLLAVYLNQLLGMRVIGIRFVCLKIRMVYFTELQTVACQELGFLEFIRGDKQIYLLLDCQTELQLHLLLLFTFYFS